MLWLLAQKCLFSARKDDHCGVKQEYCMGYFSRSSFCLRFGNRSNSAICLPERMLCFRSCRKRRPPWKKPSGSTSPSAAKRKRRNHKGYTVSENLLTRDTRAAPGHLPYGGCLGAVFFCVYRLVIIMDKTCCGAVQVENGFPFWAAAAEKTRPCQSMVLYCFIICCTFSFGLQPLCR